MYGVILGKNKHISLKELELIQPESLTVIGNVATFTTKQPEKIGELAGIIKRGRLMKISSIGPAEIIGTNDGDLGKYLKKQGLTRRFKNVEESRSDDEVITKGKEYIVIGDTWEEEDKVLMVEGYQNIGLYEAIDFEKPMNSMQIGMMPAKLAQMMINIGLAQLKGEKSQTTIYDPFVGLGTTAFLANAMGYDCIASDIDVTAMKQNVDRWNEQEFAHSDKRITVFKHDVFEAFKKPFLKNANLIVTEGWLGPIITDRSSEKEIFNAQDKIIKLYKAFLTNIMSFYDTITAVFTIPIHTGPSYVKESIEERCQDNKVEYEFVTEVYKRTGQKVGRQIVIVKK